MTSIYLDTNALIRLVETEDDLFDRLLDNVRDQGDRLCTSEFTLAEVLVIPLRENDVEKVGVYETLFADESAIAVIPVDRAVLRRSAELRAEDRGKAPDAIHVATAALSGCRILVSSDQRLRLPPGMTRVGTDDVLDIGRPQ